MSEIIVVASFTAKEGRAGEALSALEALVEPTHAEDGCILYALHQGADDRRRLAVVERWESQDHLQAHLGSQHVQDALARVNEVFADGGDIVIYEARPGGKRSQGSLAEHAAG